jgi:hypothetical protein
MSSSCREDLSRIREKKMMQKIYMAIKKISRKMIYMIINFQPSREGKEHHRRDV